MVVVDAVAASDTFATSPTTSSRFRQRTIVALRLVPSPRTAASAESKAGLPQITRRALSDFRRRKQLKHLSGQGSAEFFERCSMNQSRTHSSYEESPILLPDDAGDACPGAVEPATGRGTKQSSICGSSISGCSEASLGSCLYARQRKEGWIRSGERDGEGGESFQNSGVRKNEKRTPSIQPSNVIKLERGSRSPSSFATTCSSMTTISPTFPLASSVSLVSRGAAEAAAEADGFAITSRAKKFIVFA